jgi:alpha-glucoside transport system permease protein
MEKSAEVQPSPGIGSWLVTNLARILISIFVPLVTFIVLWQGFLFLRDADAPQLVQVIVAIIWGVGGVAVLYVVANWVVEQFPPAIAHAIQPFVFVGPALAILIWYLALPTLRTLLLSFQNDVSTQYVGLANYIFALTDRIMLEAFRNNLLWMIFGTFFSVGLG